MDVALVDAIAEMPVRELGRRDLLALILGVQRREVDTIHVGGCLALEQECEAGHLEAGEQAVLVVEYMREADWFRGWFRFRSFCASLLGGVVVDERDEEHGFGGAERDRFHESFLRETERNPEDFGAGAGVEGIEQYPARLCPERNDGNR